MPRPAHRRCKEQGPTCNGVSHPGHDICARCLNDVVRPRRREEREAVKSRRAMRAMHNKLSKENRELINATDLKEPQMRPETPPWVAQDTEVYPISIQRAIGEVELDRRLEGIPHGQPQVEVLLDDIVQMDLKRIPYPLITRDEPIQPQEEPVVTDTRPTGRPRLRSAETEAEIIEMFKSGISTTEIQIAYGIGAQTLYTLVRRAGVPLRGNHGPRPRKDKPVSEPVTSSPPVSEVPSAVATPNGAVSDLAEWVVTYEVVRTETVTVAARDFNAAAASITAGTVLSVARKR